MDTQKLSLDGLTTNQNSSISKEEFHMRSLTAALTTALVVGATSATRSQREPVPAMCPADHWAYDAVAQLADDGIIEGYGDGATAARTRSRYEMAQMVAGRWRRRDQANAQRKAMIDASPLNSAKE